MSEKTAYLLDAGTLIDAKRLYYAPDFCPAFWDALKQAHEQGRVFSIDRVKDEIDRGKDALTDWANDAVPAAFFLDSRTTQVAGVFAPLMQWVHDNPQFKGQAEHAFARADSADGWLIAVAKLRGMSVVTSEVYNPDQKRKVPIPNVCRQFDVPYKSVYAMLRDLQVRFVLE